MIKREANLQELWGQYMRGLNPRWYGYFELKQTSTNSFYFDKIEQSQMDGLPAVQKKGFYWKLSDADFREKPCDCLSAPPLTSYLVIKFTDAFYAVPFDEILEMIKEGHKNITKAEASVKAERVIYITNKR